MAKKSRIREINIVDKGGTFSSFFKMMSGETNEYDYEGLSALRKILSNEKARLLNTIKTKTPNSIYHLAKLLGRDFKSVSDDIKLLERFGFIDLISEKTGNRERLKPVLAIDALTINIRL